MWMFFLLMPIAALPPLRTTSALPPCPRTASGYDLAAMNCAAPGPVAPPSDGLILAPFCDGDYKGRSSICYVYLLTAHLNQVYNRYVLFYADNDGAYSLYHVITRVDILLHTSQGKCSGGMGNWWSPSISAPGDGVVVVTALGKSSTSTTHNTPTFMKAFRSTDYGRTFASPITLLPENGKQQPPNPTKRRLPSPPLSLSLAHTNTHKHAQTHTRAYSLYQHMLVVTSLEEKKLLLLFMLTCVPDDAARLFIIRSLFF